jgi:afadin
LSTDTIVRVAENTVDEVTLQENREVRLEEDLILQLPFLLPEDGYSCDIVKGNLILEKKNIIIL